MMGIEVKAQEAINKAKNLWDALNGAFDLHDEIVALGGVGGDVMQDYYSVFDQDDGSSADGDYPVLNEAVLSNFLGTVEQLKNVFIDGATVNTASGHKTNIQKAVIGLNKVV